MKFRKFVFIFQMFIGLLVSSVMVFAQEPNFPKSAQPLPQLAVGEKLTYTIAYFGVPVGRATGEVREIATIRGRRAYHIVVNVNSTPVIDLIHKVRGEHHTYLDVEKHCSLRYEIRSSKNPSKVVFSMDIDPETHQAEYFYASKKLKRKKMADPMSQDRLSLGYAFRLMDVTPQQNYFVPVQTEEKKWKVRIHALSIKPMSFRKIGRFEALELVPTLDFISTLKKPGAVHGWMSLDEKRIPLFLRAKAPIFGTVTVSLADYHPGKVVS